MVPFIGAKDNFLIQKKYYGFDFRANCIFHRGQSKNSLQEVAQKVAQKVAQEAR